MFELSPMLLARIQFAFTIGFHIIFPAFTIGLASFLTFLEWCWLKTGNTHFRDVYKFWIKIFAVTFGMGGYLVLFYLINLVQTGQCSLTV
jgi:cytochrome d ubiquinol oxidase subunit I